MIINSPAIEYIKYRSTPFPLRSLIQLYCRCKHEHVYCNYFAGFKALAQFLEPIDSTNLPSITPSHSCITYEMNCLTHMLGVPIGKIYYLMLECNYGYEIATAIAQQQSNSGRLPKEI